MRPAHRSALLALLLVLALAPGLPAAEPPEPPLVLLADRLLDVRAGRVVPEAAVAVSGERIAYAGPAADLPPAAGATVLDLGDVTLLPGLMDLHTHLTVGGTGQRPRGGLFVGTQADHAFRAADNARATLYAGFTSPRRMDRRIGRPVRGSLLLTPSRLLHRRPRHRPLLPTPRPLRLA